MSINIVSNLGIINHFKISKFFKQNLGLSATIMDKSGRRSLNQNDKFAYFYNNQYRTSIYAQGNIGDIKFYTDHYIREQKFALYFGEGNEEFIFDFNNVMVREKGIDFYLGHILKTVEEKIENKKEEETNKKKEVEKATGNPDIITTNPGSVTYADVKAYLEKRQKERYNK